MAKPTVSTVVTDRVSFLIGKRVRVRVWWNEEARAASSSGDLFHARLDDVVPVGRDYYFVFTTDEATPRRAIVKTGAVLMVEEAEPKETA